MSRFFAWTRKEFREQCWALFGVAIAVALITAFPFVVMPEETTVQILDHFPGVAVALATLVLGLDLFSRETRRGTHALILRTPGAFHAAFPAKLVVFLVGVALVLALEETLRRGLSAGTGVPFPTVTRRGPDGEMCTYERSLTPQYVFGVRFALLGALGAAAVGVWHVVGSVISPRAGVGSLFGVLGLAALAVPLALLYAEHPWWFRLPTVEAFGWIAGIAVAGIAIAVVAWASGRRFLYPRRSAAVRAALAGLVVCGMATGATAFAIDRWERPDASVPEFRIHPWTTFLGAGGRHLYATTSRGPMADVLEVYERDRPSQAPARSSPPTAWTIDLAHGAVIDAVNFGGYFSFVPWTGRAHVPVPYVVRVQTTPPKSYRPEDAWTWIDTDTNRPLFVGTDRTSDARAVVATRAVMRATTPLRDSKGRHVWRLEGVVERDGEEKIVSVTPSSSFGRRSLVDLWLPATAVDGWIIRGYEPGVGEREGLWKIDAESGAVRRLSDKSYVASDVASDSPEDRFPTSGGVYLDDQHFLRCRYTKRKDGSTIDSVWLVVDHATGAYRDAEARLVGQDDDDLFAVAAGEVLSREPVDESAWGRDDPKRLVLWRPLTGERRPLTTPDPSLLSSRWNDKGGRLPDGRWLVKLHDKPGLRQGRVAFALLDAKPALLTPLTKWSDAPLDAIAVDVDGSFLAIEDGRRVVRFSAAGAMRVVVWPK